MNMTSIGFGISLPSDAPLIQSSVSQNDIQRTDSPTKPLSGSLCGRKCTTCPGFSSTSSDRKHLVDIEDLVKFSGSASTARKRVVGEGKLQKQPRSSPLALVCTPELTQDNGADLVATSLEEGVKMKDNL